MYQVFFAIGALIGIFLLSVVVSAVLLLVGIVLVIGCFAGAVMLVRAALESFSEGKPESPQRAVTPDVIESYSSEIRESIDGNYVEAHRALVETVAEWDAIVRSHLQTSIADGDSRVREWPLHKEDIRSTTTRAVYAISLDRPSPHSYYRTMKSANSLDRSNYQLRDALGKHIGTQLSP